MKLLTFAVLFCFSAFGQHSTSLTKSYSASYRGHIDAPIVPEKSVVLRVSLWSKWSSAGTSGIARFHLSGTPWVTANLSIAERTVVSASYIDQMHGCNMWIALSDGDDFPMGRVALDLTNLVDAEGNQSGVDGTGSVRLSETDYLTFVRSGSWNITWRCPSQ
jgi:hypothetical protein